MANTKFLLAGRPGVGKTTVAKRLVELLRAGGVEPRGFVAGELREFGRRVGFAVETFAGESAVLAHVDRPGPPRVGRYGVDVEAFERLALPALDRIAEGDIVVIDELGKMELASEPFCSAVSALFDRSVPVVATVGRHPFTDALKTRAGVKRVTVTTSNRDELPTRLAERLSADGDRPRRRRRRKR